MSAQILDGKKIAEEILADLKKKAPARNFKLAVVQVGESAVAKTYIGEKRRAAEELGIEFEHVFLPQNVSAEDLKEKVRSLGADTGISSLVVQLPLPKHLNAQEVLDEIPIEKDGDILSSAAFGRFVLGRSVILPPTVAAVKALLEAYHVSLKGKNVAIVGAGRLVGLPLAIWCVREKATITVANEYTKDLASITRKADVLISGVGKKGLIKGNMVKTDALVIDAGTSVEGGRSTGDVDFESVAKKAGFLTPVPGGVGPLTVACLLKNLLILSSA